MKISLFKKILLGIFITGAMVSSFSGLRHAHKVKAAVGFQYASTNNLIATTSKLYGNNFLMSTSTSLLYMTAGTGTTTMQLYTANTDQIGLNFIFVASSTATVYNFFTQESIDGNIWYTVSTPTNSNATTTYYAGTGAINSIVFASSTNPVPYSNNATTMLVHLDYTNLSANYVRFVLYLPPTSLNGAAAIQAIIKSNNTN